MELFLRGGGTWEERELPLVGSELRIEVGV